MHLHIEAIIKSYAYIHSIYSYLYTHSFIHMYTCIRTISHSHIHTYTLIQPYKHKTFINTFCSTILEIKVCNITKVIPLKRLHACIFRFVWYIMSLHFCIFNICAYSVSLPQPMHYFLSNMSAHTTLPNTNTLLEVFTTIGTPNLGYSSKIEPPSSNLYIMEFPNLKTFGVAQILHGKFQILNIEPLVKL